MDSLNEIDLNTLDRLMDEMLLILENCSDSRKPHYLNHINELKKLNRLDHDFAKILSELSENDTHSSELQEINEYESTIENVPSDSTIIYFKEAGLFRIYSDDEFEKTFACHIGTYFKNRKVYEIIDNKRPQRIFMLIDTRDTEELEKIRSYVNGYLEMKEISGKVTVYDNGSKYEIIIDYVVQNANERLAFICELTKHINFVKRDHDSSKKIDYCSEVSDIANTEMVLPPRCKTLISGVLDQYITKGTAPQTLININITNIDNSVHGQNVAINGDVNNNASVEDEDDYFMDYLEENCDWYVSGKNVKYDVLYDEYLEYGGELSKCGFSKKYQNKLYIKTKRRQTGGKRIQYVKIL